MKLVVPLLLFSSLVSSLVITYPGGASFHLPHLTATFGPPASTYSVTGDLVADYTLLCTDSSNLASKYQNQIVLIQRGVCTFTDKALNAQAMGAAAVVIGGYDENDDTLGYLGGAPGYENVRIPTVYVSGKSYQKLLQILSNYAFNSQTVQATLNSVGEAEGTIGFLNPLPTPPAEGTTTGPLVDPPVGTDPTNPYPNPPPVDTDVDYQYGESTSTLTIVWVIVGLSILVKCLIITVACRRRYRSRSSAPSSSSSSSSSSAALLTEGEVSDATPVVYATYPAPSSAFTVSSGAADEEEGALPAAPAPTPAVRSAAPARPLSASSLAMYPSIQYTPLMPQATAPSDVYAYDLEKQAIIIRG